MKTIKITLIAVLLILSISQISYAQEIPTEASDLSSLASSLGEKLANTEVPNMTEVEVKKALSYKSATAKKLASVFNGNEERKTMEKLYNLSLFSHQQSEAYLGIEKGDLYGAMAAYLYGNWAFINDKNIPDESLAAMVMNVRNLLQPKMQSTFDQASEADKKLAYEEFAIVGNWMLIMKEYFKQSPNEEGVRNIKKLATDYLQKLQVKPENLFISDEGEVFLGN